MSKLVVGFLSAALALASIGTAFGASPLPPGYSVADQESVYPGVEYQKIVKPSGPVLAHVAHILPGAPVDLRVVNGHDKIATRTADLEMTSAMCKRVHCVVGVNGDFHTLGVPVGGVISAGRMLRSPDPNRPQLTVEGTGHLTAGGFPWSAALKFSDGSQLAIGGINVAGLDGAVLYTRDWGTAAPAPGGLELVVSAAESLGPLNRAVAVTLQGVRPGPGAIPAGGAVISVRGAAADQVNALWARVQQGGASAQAQMIVQSPIDAVESMGATPVVLHEGQRALPWPNDPNLVTAFQPRTLVGWNSAGDTYMVVVDGRQKSANGLTLAQAADMLLGLGATEAVNLDGGGGSTFVVGGTVWNTPSDAPDRDPQYSERVASNAFVALARPGGPPAPKLPPRPTSGDPPAGGTTPPTTGGGPTIPLGPPAPHTGPVGTGTVGQVPGSALPGVGTNHNHNPTSTAPGGAALDPVVSTPLGLLPALLTGGQSSSSPLLSLLGGSATRGMIPGLGGGVGGGDGTGLIDIGGAEPGNPGSEAEVVANGGGSSESSALGILGPLWHRLRAHGQSAGGMESSPMPFGLIALQWAFLGSFLAVRRKVRSGLWPFCSSRPPRATEPRLLPSLASSPSRWRAVTRAMAGTWTL